MFQWEVMDEVTRLCPQRRAEAVSNGGPTAFQPNALPLGQTGSQMTFASAVVPLIN